MLSLCNSLRTFTRPTTTRRASAPLPLAGHSSEGDKLETELNRSECQEKEGRGLRPYLHLDLEAEGFGVAPEGGRGEVRTEAGPSLANSPPLRSSAVVPFHVDIRSPTEVPASPGSPCTTHNAIILNQNRFTASPPSSPIHARRSSTSSSVSSASFSRSITISTPPSSPRSGRPPSPLSRRISTRLDAEGRRVLASRRSSGSGASSGAEREPEKARRRKKVFGVGEGESSDDEVELGEGRRRFGKSTSSPALHLGEFGFEEQEQGEEAECFSDQSQEQARHHTHRRNSAPSPSPSARPRAPRSPITPHFAPLPSPPPSPRSGFSFNPPPLRRGFTMTPLRRSSPSASPRPSPSTTITDIRTPTSAPPARPHPIAHPKSSPSILRRPVEYEVSSFSVAAEVQGGGLARRRTDRRPQVLGAEQIERIADVWSERDAAGLEKGQQLSLSGRRLTIANPDPSSSNADSPVKSLDEPNPQSPSSG